MFLRVDVPTRDILAQMLESNSLHYLITTLAELEKHCQPEDFGNECMKLFIKSNEPEGLGIVY